MEQGRGVKKYSEQYLEKIKNMETDSIEVYGRFCYLEGVWVNAYAIRKEQIEQELHRLADEHGLIRQKK